MLFAVKDGFFNVDFLPTSADSYAKEWREDQPRGVTITKNWDWMHMGSFRGTHDIIGYIYRDGYPIMMIVNRFDDWLVVVPSTNTIRRINLDQAIELMDLTSETFTLNRLMEILGMRK